MRKTIGILREGYSKWERRSPLTPNHVSRAIQEQNVRVIVQPSTLRIFTNEEYLRAGAEVKEDLTECDAIIGVKQVAVDSIIPEKTYLFFSHTIKAQESNMQLLDKVLEKRVRLVDHECIRDLHSGERLVAFGEYAGRAGMLETIRGLGIRLLGLGYSTPFLNVGPAYSYKSLEDAIRAASVAFEDYHSLGGAKAFLPPGFGPLCILFTGSGKVTRGAMEVFGELPGVKIVGSIGELEQLKNDGEGHSKVLGLCVKDVDVMRKKDTPDLIDRKDYFTNPHLYTSELFARRYLPHANVVLTGAYWDERFPKWMPATDSVIRASSKLLVVADVSCDVNGTFDGLVRSTTIEDPFFYSDFGHQMREVPKNKLKHSGTERNSNLKLVLGVDILPSELPREASGHFGDCLLPFVSQLCDRADPGPILERATIAKDGELTPQYSYIGKIRAERERSKRVSALMEQAEAQSAKMIKLEGHLFDTKLINRVLDLIENKHGKFQIIQASLAQPRGGPGRELRAHTAVLVKVIGEKVAAASESGAFGTDELLVAIERLVKESPKEAEATVSRVSEEDAEHIIHGLEVRERSKKEMASWSHLDSSSSAKPPPARALSSQQQQQPHKPSSGEIVVFGAGLVSAPAIDYLLRNNPNTRIKVISGDSHELQRLRERFARSSHGQHLELVDSKIDPNVPGSIAQHLTSTETKCVLSLLPAPMHMGIAKACLDKRIGLVTASYVGTLKELENDARRLQVPILCEMGLDPGMDHMSCCKMIEEGGGGNEVIEFESYCGGLPAPECAENPLGYKLSWSPRGVLTALKNPAKFIRNGRVMDEPCILNAFEPFHLSGFAFPSLNLELLPNRDSTQYAGPYGVPLQNGVKTFFRGTLRFKGFCEVLSDLQKNSWLDEEKSADGLMSLKGKTWGDVCEQASSGAFSPRTRAYLKANKDVPVDVSKGTRLDALCELLKVSLSMKPSDRDLVLMEHRIRFRSGERMTSTLIEFGNSQDSAMARTVGLTAAIGVQLVVENKAPEGGIHIPTMPWVYKESLKRLEEEGIRFHDTKSR